MLRPWKIASRYLDLELAPAKGLRVRIVERPGRWMDEAEVAGLVANLRAVAGSVLAAGELTYGVLTGDKERLDRVVVTLVEDRASGRPIAFNALSVMPVHLRGRETEVLHLGLVMVDPEHRSRGMSWILYGLTCMLLFFRNQLRPLWVSNVTQVPAIVGMVSESFDDVFPRAGGEARRSHDHLVLAREILRRHRSVFGVGSDARFDSDRFVIENAYTGGSDDLKKAFDEAAKHRDERYNAMCAESLDYARGDDFLQLGKVTLGVARRYLTKSVPRESWLWFLSQALFAAVSSVVLPAIHWLSPNRPMGELRPWRE